MVSGCGRTADGPQLGKVSGQITLDGKPLANAVIGLTPEGQSGSPSYGTTNEQGQYTLKYSQDRQGATVGRNLVRITTARMEEDEQGEDKEVPEKLPPKYHVEAESNPDMQVEVKPGENTFDFELKSE